MSAVTVGRPGGETERTSPEEAHREHDSKSVRWIYVLLLGITFLGLLLVGYTGYSGATGALRSGAAASGVAAVIFCLAFFSSGGLLGFLFGIPRSYARPAADETAEGADDRARLLETNSNLVQVSDWLTKILVGVALVQLNEVPEQLKNFGAFAERSFGGAANGRETAVASLLFFSVTGFLTGYLATRLILQAAFNRADEKLIDKLIKQEAEQVFETRQQQSELHDRDAFVIAQSYLFAPQRPQKKQEAELDRGVQQASGAAREQIFQLCRTERRNTTNRQNPLELPDDERRHLLHRAIDIFEALQEADAKYSGDYRVYAELGYAYEGLGRLAEPRERKECNEKAEQALGRAIQLRKQTGRKNQFYEFYRAVVRIRLGREVEAIKDDLRVAFESERLRNEAKTSGEVTGWLQDNRTTIDELVPLAPAK